MKVIEVVGAIIRKGSTILTTQRGHGQFKGMWEFPGGKIEEGETREEALIREVKEELDVEIHNLEFFMTIEYDYPDFHLIFHSYLCEVKKGNITLLEHEASKWVNREELESVQWLPADIDIIKGLKKIM